MLYFGGIGTRINFSDQLDNDIIPNRGSAARINIDQIASPIARLHRFAGYVKCIRLPVTINRGRASRISYHRSEEHTSELESLMRISYAVLCLKILLHYILNLFYIHLIQSHSCYL